MLSSMCRSQVSQYARRLGNESGSEQLWGRYAWTK